MKNWTDSTLRKSLSYIMNRYCDKLIAELNIVKDSNRSLEAMGLSGIIGELGIIEDSDKQKKEMILLFPLL